MAATKLKLETFGDVVASIKKNGDRPFHLLLGNGFSMAYDSKIFSYNALHDFILKTKDKLLADLLELAGTQNFELIMHQLDTFAKLADIFGSDKKLKQNILKTRGKLQMSLLSAVKALHPEHVFKVPQEKSDSCAKFLRRFLNTKGHIYTTNYDLLLYWVLMRNQVIESVDGFGRDRENAEEYVPEDELEYSELRWGKHKDGQVIFYLHGALPLFDTGVDIVKEVYDSQHYLLQNISERMDKGEYPVFVTAGNGRDKLTAIKHNQYLVHAYENLCNAEGSLVSFGFNFGQYDEHIIEAINAAAKNGKKIFPKLLSIYIGVYSDGDKRHIESIAHKFKCKVHVYDAKTVPVWT